MRSAALLKAIKEVGSVTRLAELLDVRPQAISQWSKVPAMRVLLVERITGVSRHELRPDLYPRELPKKEQKPLPWKQVVGKIPQTKGRGRKARTKHGSMAGGA